MKPSDYPPPFESGEFVVAPGEAEIEVGVLIVGAGPAGLACAIRLGQLLEGAPELADRLGDVPVAVLEKGRQPGSHLLSGAVVNPRSLRRLFDGRYRAAELPFYGRVEHESVYFLTPQRSLRIPTPPTMKNGGNYVASLSQLGRWLAERAEEGGATILPETSGHALLVGDGRVRGVRTGAEMHHRAVADVRVGDARAPDPRRVCNAGAHRWGVPRRAGPVSVPARAAE